MLWGPFLIKILLEKKFMGPMNSAQDPLEKLKRASQKKKKNADTDAQKLYPHVTIISYNSFYLTYIYIYIYIFFFFFFF